MRGGSRKNSGRRKIDGKPIKVTLENGTLEKLKEKFPGECKAEQVRKAINMFLNKKEEHKPKLLDMFCGCGGLSKGFMDSGYEIIAGIDNESVALETFKLNHGDAKGLNINLFDENAIDQVIEKIGDIKIDVLVGGPPCQGFSLAGKRKENDDRNKLYKSMVNLAKRLKPKAIVIENVPSLATLYKGIAKESIIKDFKELGYKMGEPKVLYGPDYGIPQIRKRIFFVGILDSKETFEYPKPIKSPEEYITCEQAIGDLPSLENTLGEDKVHYSVEPFSDYQKLMRKNSNKIYNHLGTKHSEKTKYLINLIPEGKNYKALPDDDKMAREFKSKKRYNESLTRYHSKKPSRTIDTGHRTHFHYKENRIPSVRENARLQSFPDDFIIIGNKQEQYRQVGNAVPPLMGYHLGKQLKKYLKKEDN